MRGKAFGKIKEGIGAFSERLLGLLFPERCVFCDRTVFASDNWLCPDCRDYDRPVTEGYCMKCGKSLAGREPSGELYYITGEFCADCSRKKHGFERGRSLYTYNAGVAESIYRFKYGGRRRYAMFYGRRMAECFERELRQWGVQALIPVPLHASRLRRRGYNQAELLADEIGRCLGIRVCTDIVERCRNTKPLKLLDPGERQVNLKNAFKIGQYEVKLNTVALIDDIYTTGSTVDEISKLLRQAGVSRVFFLTAASGVQKP